MYKSFVKYNFPVNCDRNYDKKLKCLQFNYCTFPDGINPIINMPTEHNSNITVLDLLLKKNQKFNYVCFLSLCCLVGL